MITEVLVQAVGGVLGTGVGTYFGFRVILNGIRADVREIKDIIVEVRDVARETRVEANLKQEHMAANAARYAQEIREDIREGKYRGTQ